MFLSDIPKWVKILLIIILILSLLNSTIYGIVGSLFRESMGSFGEKTISDFVESQKLSLDSNFELLNATCKKGTIRITVKNVGENPSAFTRINSQYGTCNSCAVHTGAIYPNETGEASCDSCSTGEHNFLLIFNNTINVNVTCNLCIQNWTIENEYSDFIASAVGRWDYCSDKCKSHNVSSSKIENNGSEYYCYCDMNNCD